MTILKVINARGEIEPFSVKKVYRSAKRAGASRQLAEEITEKIKKEAYSGIKTQKIFTRIKQLLNKQSPKASLKFNLKEAMRSLGPTGFPFEKYIASIFEQLGYQVEINRFLSGKCISDYETDFIAKKENLIYIGECKYRKFFGDRVHSQDVLANYARFLDILNGNYFKTAKYKGVLIKSLMVTNTKFSSRSINYAKCVGIELLGWNSPKNAGLEYYIDKNKLYPITILPSLKGHLKDVLVEKRIMLAKDLLRLNIKEFARKNNISEKSLITLTAQAKILLE